MFSKAAINYAQSRILENLDLYGSQETRDPLVHFSRTVLDIEQTRAQWMNKRPIPILSLLRKFRPREASDRRDKVFALLGLVRHWEYGSPIFPDYSLTPEEIFWRTTVNIISSTRTIEVLVGRIRKSFEQNSTPSWITDWSVPPEHNEYERLSHQELYNASLGLEGTVCLHGKRVLEVQGHFVDEIVFIHPSRVQDGQVARIQQVISEWLGWISPKLDTALRDTSGRKNAFWRTICGNTLYSETGVYQKADASGDAAFVTWMGSGNVLERRRTTAIIDSQWQDYAEFSEVNKSKNSFHYSVETASGSRAFFVTRKGYIGTGPQDTKKGDQIFVLLGSRIPFILRPIMKPCVCYSEPLRLLVSAPKEANRDSTCSQSHAQSHAIVGDTYVHGYMEGKAIKNAAMRGEEPQPVFLT